MASSDETLVEWLNSVSSPSTARIANIHEIVDGENELFKQVVEEITGAHGAEPVSALENWFREQDKIVIIDRGNPTSAGTAALGAAVSCDSKDVYIRKMMELPQHYQGSLMLLIEQFNNAVDVGEAQQLRTIVKRLERENAALKEMQQATPSAALSLPKSPLSGSGGGGDSLENKRLQEKVKELERKLKDTLSHTEELEVELDEKNEMHEKGVRSLEEKIQRYEEEIRVQADELDVARAKSAQLIKSEAKVTKLMQKLEETSQLRNQLKELQDENQVYLEKKLDMEAEVKTVATVKEQLESYKNKTVDLESQIVKLQSDLKTKGDELEKLNGATREFAEKEKYLKDELEASKETVAHLEAELDLAGPSPAPKGTLSADLSVDNTQRTLEREKEALERKLRGVEAENKQLKSQLEKAEEEKRVAVAAAASSAVAAAVPAPSSAPPPPPEDSSVVEDLKAKLKATEAERLQLVTAKEKLQSYVKQSLHATQQKYKLGIKALQEQLEAKESLIKQFKEIRAEDSSLHQQEKDLLASAVYEIGLDIQRRAAFNHQSSGSWLGKSRKQV
mmetsp:Transcript_13206/g.21447  ORF Transcript_13206/g.21447 Transcript_13206/m.21447 type:complete len:564 (+) Transcript_13206:195-1886(+)